MKILCVADHVDPLGYSSSIRDRFAGIDLVLGAGDLPMEYLGYIASSLNKRIFFVFGNHHLEHLARFSRHRGPFPDDRTEPFTEPVITNYFGSTCIEGRGVRHDKLLVAGLGGCSKYNRGAHQYSEFQMRMRILRLAPRLFWNRIVHGRYLDILLTHAAPLGLNDRPDPTHIGFRAFLRFMERYEPRYLLHGHIHLYDINAKRAVRYGKTEIINVYDHYVLDFSPGTQ